MANKDSHSELIRRAQLGEEKCLNDLAKLARERLRVYVHRLTLADDLTQDIVQESLLEMFKFLDKLERVDRFWPWLFKIATNNIRDHYERQRHRKTVSILDISEAKYMAAQNGEREGLENLVGQELKQIVSLAMLSLKHRYQMILTLRCYEEMKYSEIADIMECSEFNARMLFVRAKRALAKQLSRRGFGKGSLLMALTLFGQMTAPSEAAAAQISVTAATTKVGVTASVAAMAASKATVVSLATAGVLAVGTMAIPSKTDMAVVTSEERLPGSSQVATQAVQANADAEEHWYYFPSHTKGAVLMKLMAADSQGKHPYCRYFQDERANYYFDSRRNTIYTNNYRRWHANLAVQRLPTDSPDLSEFLSQFEGQQEPMEYVRLNGDGLLVTVKNHTQTIYPYDVLDEEFFRYNWPTGAKTVDNRDAMHKQGWTYFRVSGQVGGEDVSGVGRVPFVYAACGEHWPWLRIYIDGEEFIDAGSGRLFKGLARPWLGLHTIDTVRRDAVEAGLWFETQLLQGSGKAEVTVIYDGGKLVYTIDMECDLIDRIIFSSSEGEGELVFTYLQEIDEFSDEFTAPRRRSYQARAGPGILWLIDLATN